MYDKSILYTEKSAKETLSKIEKIEADMGATNIYGPIESTFEKDLDPSCPRNLFLLTDGMVSNVDRIVELIKKNNTRNRVHTFGIGNAASKELVFTAADAGKGTYTFLSDNDSMMNAKVIKALKLAARPAFYNISILWSGDSDAVKLGSSTEIIDEVVYEEDLIWFPIIFNKEKTSQKVSLIMSNTLTNLKETIHFDWKRIQYIDSDSIFLIAAQNYIKQIEDHKISDIEKQNIIEASLEYNVLCKFTSFFGFMKTWEKSKNQTKFVEISKMKLAKQNNQVSKILKF